MSPHTRQPSRRSLLALAALAPTASALLASCSSSATGTPLTSTVTRETVSLDSVRTSLADAVTACDELGAQLLNHLLTQSPGTNALASPLSLALALALVADGATDATTQGYDKLLGVSGQERDQTWSAVQTALNRNDRSLDGFDPGKPPETPLVHVANHVVVVDRKDLTVSQTYLDTVLRWFSAQIEKVPLGDLADNLSKWADKNTAGLIKKTGVQVTSDTALVLQNALLFAAQWDTPFKAEDTREGTFTRADGSTTQTKFMHGTRIIPYAYGQGWAAVRLGYQGGELDGQGLAMDVVLPNQGTSPADLPPATWAQASAALDQAAAGSDQNEVRIVLPKLDLTSGPVELLEMLKALGLDTSSLDGIALGLSISQVVQQVRLLVDEEGTVAAALTEVGLTAGAAPDQSKPIDFVVDHPYVLRLRDLATGTTLVQAAIMDPAA
ncbi:serpin family protein [Actinomyces sp. oral taxon 897]|uniref:serpin family protein n=1 Tax=Actinomyces sp. oral taxon 897 TaxID=2081702 RepID=UPI000D03DEF6|nr:serpin family protein [Actinomyces sp. oral taxon 897]AVM62033.1 serpin [Actinomyces sp. oral taxon 897]